MGVVKVSDCPLGVTELGGFLPLVFFSGKTFFQWTRYLRGCIGGRIKLLFPDPLNQVRGLSLLSLSPMGWELSGNIQGEYTLIEDGVDDLPGNGKPELVGAPHAC